MKKGIFFIPFLLFLSSCLLHPKYEQPTLESGPDWRTPLPSEGAIEMSWWEQFQDPVLDQLITQALAANQDILVAVSRVDQFKAQLGIANSQFYPQVQGDAAGSRQQMSKALKNTTNITYPVFNTAGAIFQASYYADIWGAVRSSSESAYHEWLASIETRRAVVLAIVSALSSSYIQLRQFDGQLIISKDTVDSRNEALRLAKIRFELGLTSQMEVEQAIAEVEIAQIQVERLKIAIAETENLISVLLGQASQDIPRGRKLDDIAMPHSVPSYTPADIVRQRPDVMAAENNLIAANARIGIAWAQFYPQVNLLGAIGSQSSLLSTFFTNPAKIFEYGATIMQEIFTGGRLTSGVDLANAVKAELLHSYLSTVLKAFQEANNAMADHTYSLELVETQRIRVEATKSYLHLSDLRYKEGEIDYLTFLDAERQYFQAQLDYEESIGYSFTTFIQIYQALGGPWVTGADDQVMQDVNKKVDPCADEE